MKIDYEKIVSEARRKQVSPYILVKRKLNYRPIDIKSRYHNCSKCRFRCDSPYGENRLLCHTVGIIKDDNAIVDSGHICNNYKY